MFGLYFRKNITAIRGISKRFFLSESYKCLDKSATTMLQMCNNISNTKFPLDIEKQNVHELSETGINEIKVYLQNLRSTVIPTTVLDATNHAIVYKLVDYGSFHQLLDILHNVMEYGVRLDEYTACFILNALVHRGRYGLATQLSIKCIEKQHFKNILLQSLSIYSIYSFILSRNLEPQVASEEDYINDIIDTKEIGLTLVDLSYSATNKNIQANVQLLGLIMCKNYEEAIELLNLNFGIFYKEILSITLNFIKLDEDKNRDLTTTVEQLLVSKNILCDSFASNLRVYIDNMVVIYEPILIKRQLAVYEKWLSFLKKELNAKSLQDEKQLRLEAVEKLIQHVDLMEKQVWFFKNEDKINVEIQNKKQIYPKKWFGKKKKPHKLDVEYIPPVL